MPMTDDLRTRKLRITGTLVLDARGYPQDDALAEEWLINDILLGGRKGDALILHSNEIGDEVGVLHIEKVEIDA